MTPWVFQGPLTPLHNNMSIREALKDSQRSKEVAYSLWCPILRASAERILLSLQRHMSAVKSEESRSTYSNVRTSEYCYRCFLCRCTLLTATPLTSPNEVPRPKLCQDCDMAVNTLVNTWHDSIANHLGSPLLSSTSFPLSSPRPSTHISLISLRGFLIASSTDREMIKTRIVRDKVLVEGILQNDLQRSVQFANSVYRRSVCPASDTIFTDNMEFIARYLLDFSRGTALEPNPIAILEIDTSHRYTEDPFESNIVVENVNQHILSSPFDTSLATALGQCLAYLAQSVVLEWISSIACKCHANSTTTQRRLESSEKLGEIIHYYVRSEIDVICGLNCDILTVGHLYSLPSSNFDYLACDFVLSLFEFVATEALYLSTKGNTTLDSSRGVFAPCTVTDLENQQELQASIPGQTGKCEGNNGIKHIRVVTGCACIDSIVGNVGFPLGQLSEIYGEAGSGKTQIGIATLAHTVAQGIVLSDIHSKDPKSCSSSVSAIYFVAEDLPQCRLKEFATGAARDMLMRESDCSGNEDSVETISTIILQNIFIRKIIDLDHFIEILKDSNGTGLIRFIQDKNVKVIVVDSIAAAAQSTASSLSNPKRCRDDLYNVKENVCFTNSPSILIEELGSLLASIAASCLLAVLVLNQVRAIITDTHLSSVNNANRRVVGDCRTGWTLDQPYMLAEEYMKACINMCTRSVSGNSSNAPSSIPSLYTPALGLRWAQCIHSRFCVVKSQTMVDVERILIGGCRYPNKQPVSYQPLRIIQGVFSPVKDVTGGSFIHTINSAGTFVVQTDGLKDMTGNFF